MGSLLPVDIYIIVREDGTAYRRYAYSLLFHTHLFDHFGNEFMHHTVRAARTVVHIIVVHERRLLADDILGLNYLISIHFLISLFYSFTISQLARSQIVKS
jgi:hypothetical protein